MATPEAGGKPAGVRLGPRQLTFTLPCCDGCCFLLANYAHKPSGPSKWYSLCCHPDAGIPDEQMKAKRAPTIQERRDDGRKPILSPDWCPVLKGATNES